MSDTRTIAEIMIGLPVIGGFVSVITQQRRSLLNANKALDEERDSCSERFSMLETRMDKERDDCDRRHRAVTSEIDDLRREMRTKYTPRPFPAVKEPSK